MGGSFFTSVAVNLVSKLGEYLFAPIGRQFGYVLCYKSYVEDLKNGVKELETAWERVQRDVQEAENNGKPIHSDVKNWLKSVKEETEKTNNLFKYDASAKNACFRGWLPNPLVRHPIGRKVKKITEVIQGLQEKSRESKFQKVYYENPPPGIVNATASAARYVDKKEDVLESRAKITEEVMKAIVDDKIYVIGVHGPGGVGKSKLLNDIERRVKENNLFHEVARANVSCNLDLKRIQGEIAYAIGLKLMNEETALGRADRLCKRLENDPKKNILIILDDLWDRLELKDVGIPCEDDNKVKGCKLLLTSRNRNVLRTHMGSDREFQLNVLDHGEARKLFERTVGDRVNDPEFVSCVDGAVKNCGGLPLSIVSLAKMLKHKDLAAWINASTNRDLSNVKSLVELSYNDIKEERIRLVFLVCALTSGGISTRDFLVYCMGLGLYKEFNETIQNARCQLIVDLCSLQDCSLLLDNYDREQFRMHDIYVDVAISIASTEWNALVGRKGYGFKLISKDELRKCTVISFRYVGIDELPAKMDCPNLRMLMIFESETSLKIPESFFESMEKLQVLHFGGLSFTSLTSSIQFLEHLKSLSLNSCRLEDVTVLGKLKGLQFLSFARSTITRLPKEIGELTELRFLDLRWCFSLGIIEPGMLGSLVNLEELYIDCFDQWEAEDEALRSNASLAELNKMKKLKTLYIAIPHSTNFPSDLPFGNLNEHNIQIGMRFWWVEFKMFWWFDYKESRTLELKLDSDNLLHEVWMQECLGRTQDLLLDGLRDGRDSIHDLCTEGFQDLKHLHVKNSLSFHYVVDSIQCPTFTRLESLVLENMNNLEKICRDCLALKSFIKLKTLKVKKCREIKHLFPSFMTKIFLQLEEIEIIECQLMQQIVADAEANEYRDEIDDDANVKSCKLRKLTLQDLPKMTSFYKTRDHSAVFLDGQQVSLPWLETLTLSKLPKLKEIWNSIFPLDVGSLKFLKVVDCAFLLSIIPSNLIVKLQNLEAITVKRCQLIREVFDLEGLTTSGDVAILSQLTRLTLSGLPSLERMWNENPRRALCFRNLTVVKVKNCENLRFSFSSSMAKALGQIKEIEIASCKLMEEVVAVQEESEEAATNRTLEFPLLTSLSLKELPNLKAFSCGKYCIRCPSLTQLTISECPKMMTFSSFEGKQQSITSDAGLQQVFGRVNSDLSLPVFFNEKVLFASLEELKLSSMPELKRIWQDQFHKQSFCKLASLTLELCENLSHVFPSNSMDRLQSLKKIQVVDCPSLEALFEPVCLSSEKRPKPLVLSSLEKMKLLNLPRLRDISKSDGKVPLAFPSLMEVNVSHCHSLPYLFSTAMPITVAKLAVLDVSSCNNLRGIIGMENGEANNAEILKFHHLSTLKLGDLEKLISFRSASRPDDGLHPLFDEKVLFPSLVELKLSSMCQLKRIWHNQLHGQSYKLESLTVEHCENLSHVFPSNLMDRLQSLNKIEAVGCPSLEALFELVSLSSERRQKPLVLSALKKMKLLNLPSLREILMSDCKVTLAFPSLMEVNVRRCHSLPYLFSSATAKTLDKLAVLDVSCCNNLRGIIAMEEGKGKTIETFKFHHLTKLKLSDLKSLIYFTSESCAGDGLHPLFDEKLAFPKLEELHVEGVQQKELWNDKILVESFCHLKVLKVKQCDNLVNVIPSSLWNMLLHCMESLTIEKCPCLRNLFTMSMAKSLGQLRYLGLSGCGDMEYIVAKEEEKPEEATNKVVIPQLATLYLHNMPKLKSFCQGKHISEWPSLKEFSIEYCEAVKVILGDASCRKLEGSGPTHQPLLLVEKIDFPSMESMKILHMDNVEKIWLDNLDSNAFSKLKTLKVKYCEKLSSIFSSYNLLTRFQKLEKITVTDCEFLEVVFQVQEFNFSETHSPSTFQLRELILKRLPKIRHVWRGLPQGGFIFGRLQCMKVVKCESLKSLFPSSVAKSMTQLVELLVRECGVEEIIVKEDGVGMNAGDLFFPGLTDLRLLELPKLMRFFGSNHNLTWPLLKQLRVRHCGKMRSFSFAHEFQICQGTTTGENKSALFSFEKVIPQLEGLTLAREDVAMMSQHHIFCNLRNLTLACYHDENVSFPSNFLLHGFPNLEELLVKHSSFEEIFPEDSFGHGGVTSCGELTEMGKPLQALQNLKRLDLNELCDLKRVWKDGSLMVEILKQIKVLWVMTCPSLSMILPSPTSFQSLTYLGVEDCAGLVHMGTCLAVTSLVHLTWLCLRNCVAMEDVVTDDGNGVEDISFPNLQELILDGLPSLESFSPTNYVFRFPLLVRIVIMKCPKINIFCKGALRTPDLHKVLLSKEDNEGCWEGDLNTTIQTLSA